MLRMLEVGEGIDGVPGLEGPVPHRSGRHRLPRGRL